MRNERPTIGHALAACLHSRACQAAGVALMFLLVAARHWQNDGLWFGDAPQHAINGLFWWDYLGALPRDPMEFALRYYARYPVINPVKYPPLFYLFEGLGFATFGPSPHAAKAIVLLFGVMAGLYTLAWTRRWIAPAAGWAGAFLTFTPGMVVLTNAVMLNVPALALGLASLYHLRCWLEAGATRQLVLAAVFLTAVLLTYYQGAIVLCICAAWVLLRRRDLRITRGSLWIAAMALCALIPVVVSVWLGPVHASRHLPSVAFLTRSTTWTFYWRALPEAVGVPALALGLAGTAAGLVSPRWRREATYVALWIAALIVGVAALPARDSRYILLAAPAFVIAAAIGVASVGRFLARLHPAGQAAILAASLCAGFWSAVRVPVPNVSGFREIALYLREQAPKDGILYEGGSEGLFGFYLRASDPNFERRLVRADKLVYERGATTSFQTWFSRSNVTSTDDVVQLLRTRSGSRWVAVEMTRRPNPSGGQRLLREAVLRPEFELIRSFPIHGKGERRVDLYRLVDPVQPVDEVDLRFPSFTPREFPGIVPISRD